MNENYVTESDIYPKFKRIVGNELSYREVNVESFYQELLEKDERTDDEKFLLMAMEGVRNKSIGKNNLRDELFREIYDTTKITMPTISFFDWDSRPINSWEFYFKKGFFPTQVGKDTIKGYVICTLWLGSIIRFGSKQLPEIFETMVFPENMIFCGKKSSVLEEKISTYPIRYSFLRAAEEGHAEACKLVEAFS